MTGSNNLVEHLWKTLKLAKFLPWVRQVIIQQEIQQKLALGRVEIQLELERKLMNALPTPSPDNIYSRTDNHGLTQYYEEHYISEYTRKEINLANAVCHAHDELLLSNEEISQPPEMIELDWLFRWRDYASNYSDQEMRKLWGKILAGEIKNPGQFSYKTLDILNQISPKDAKLFMKIASCTTTLNDNSRAVLISYNEIIKNHGIITGDYLDLSELGLINPDEKSINVNIHAEKCYFLISNNKLSLIFDNNQHQEKNLILPIMVLTKAGLELLKLIDVEPNKQFFIDLAQNISEKNQILCYVHEGIITSTE